MRQTCCQVKIDKRKRIVFYVSTYSIQDNYVQWAAYSCPRDPCLERVMARPGVGVNQ